MWPFSRPEPRGFFPEEKIVDFVKESNSFIPEEDLPGAGAMLIFETSEVRSWLVVTKYRIYNITDEPLRKEPVINWSISRSRIVAGSSITLQVTKHPKDGETATVDIGYRKENLYGRRLFPQDDIVERVYGLLRSKMVWTQAQDG